MAKNSTAPALRPSTIPADNLTVTVPTDRPVVVFTRVFDAPRDLVWAAMTEPKHIAVWWGPKSRTPSTRVVKHDLRIGGEWRYESTTPDGTVIAFKGRYLEIEPPSRIVNTFGVEGMFGGKEGKESLVLEDLGGRTRCTATSYFDTAEERDAVLQTGMADGGRESYNQLAQLLAELQA